MSRTLFSLAGFQVILIGRFWVIAEVSTLTVKATGVSAVFSPAFRAVTERLPVLRLFWVTMGFFLSLGSQYTAYMRIYVSPQATNVSESSIPPVLGQLGVVPKTVSKLTPCTDEESTT